MTASLVARLARVTVWPILQTAVAAGLAWYLAHDVLGHVQPFFAPIAAAVCLWATNVVRAELAVEMMIGVAVGIGLGTGVHAALGRDPIAMAVAVLLSLSVAVVIGQGFIAQRPMFVNQTVMSAILILVFPHRGFGLERLSDALIGGGLAVAFSILLFPKNPLTVLRDACGDVLAAVRDILAEVEAGAADRTPGGMDRLHQQLARLTEARSTARQLAWICPRRWPLRAATHTADRRAAQLAALCSSVLQLARVVTAADVPTDPLRVAIGELAGAATALAAGEPGPAAAHAAAARRHAAALHPATPDASRVLLAAALDTCVDELEQVLDWFNSHAG